MPDRRLRVGVVGAGMIAQVEHIPNLLHLRDRFEVVGVAVPDRLHGATVLAALDAGLHVFCEKPLCFTAAEGAAVVAARDRAGRVVQVGYMKRVDPNYEAALGYLPEGGEGLRYISVEVCDPDSWPFLAHRPLVRPDDVPAALIADTGVRQRAQAAEALGVEVNGAALRGYCDPLMSGVVHCVNAVHGMLDHMGVGVGEVVGGRILAAGESAAGTVSLLDGRALWHLAQVLVSGVGRYRERYVLHFADRVVELEFPSPYLNHQQTDLRVRRSDGLRLDTLHVQAGYEEAFVSELEGFWASAVGGEPVRNPVEDAIRDARLLTDVARYAIREMTA